MLCLLNSTVLCKTLLNISTIQSSNPKSLNILSRCFFRNGKIIMESENSECLLQVSMDTGNDFEEIQFEFDSKFLYDYLATIEDCNIGLEINKNILQLKTQNKKISIPIKSFQGHLKNVSRGDQTHISTIVLFEKLNKILFAITKQDYSLALSAVNFTKRGKEFVGIGTNGLVLSKVNISEFINLFKEDDTLVSKNSLLEMIKVFNGEEEVCISYTKPFINFEKGNKYLRIRAMDMSYVKIDNVIPKSFSHEIKLPKEKIKDSLKLLSRFGSSSQSIVEFKTSKDHLIIKSYNDSNFFFEENIDCECDVTLEVRFNAKHLLEMVEHCTGDKIHLSFNNLLSPFQIKDNSPYIKWESIILPLRV